MPALQHMIDEASALVKAKAAFMRRLPITFSFDEGSGLQGYLGGSPNPDNPLKIQVLW